MEPNDVFESVMKGRWDAVVEAYANNPSIQHAKITISEDTALHIAVSDGRTKVVLRLVEILGQNASTILHINNERGNTPLHLAASLGDVRMCHCLATKDVSLIRVRNSENETPLFLSALHGKKEAFLCLHFLYKQAYAELEYSLCRKSNGDTILHAAISGEHLSLAFQIICDYPDLVNSVNEDGQSPLHILASKPNAFKSGSVLLPVDRLIYHCMMVNEVQEETHDPELCLQDLGVNGGPKYPQNYETWMNILHAFRTCFQVLTKREENGMCHQTKKLLRVKGVSENHKLNDEENAPKNISLSYDSNLPKKGVKRIYPPNYETFSLFVKVVLDLILVILGFGISKINHIREKKKRHVWANQIMNELVQRGSLYKYEDNGRDPRNTRPEEHDNRSEILAASPSSEIHKESPDTDINKGLSSFTANQEKDRKGEDTHGKGKRETPTLVAAKLGLTEMVDKLLDTYPMAIQELNTAQKNLVLLAFEKKEAHKVKHKETPLLIAAKMGVTELVDKILDVFPLAIRDLDSQNKNVVLQAVEHRQIDVYNLLLKKAMLKESVFRQLDKQGNSALHLAAKLGAYRPKLIPGAALQMQWEIKWYRYVKNSMPPHFVVKHNNMRQTPKEIFTNTHRELVVKGSQWLTKTSESCSVVAALIATVAFPSLATVPGGIDEKNGTPVLQNKPGFNVFAIASLVAFSFSVTALIFFLTILTSRYQESDFAMDLPRKLFLGLTTLFASIAAMLISFCAGHFFVLSTCSRYVAYPLYAATCLPISFFALAQLPLYFDLGRAIFKKEPQRSYKHKVSLSHTEQT